MVTNPLGDARLLLQRICCPQAAFFSGISGDLWAQTMAVHLNGAFYICAP